MFKMGFFGEKSVVFELKKRPYFHFYGKNVLTHFTDLIFLKKVCTFK